MSDTQGSVNRLLIPPQVDEVPVPSYVFRSVENRCAGILVLTKLPKALSLLAALLLTMLGVGVGSSPAAAHGSHSHQVVADAASTGSAVQVELHRSTAGDVSVAADATLPMPSDHQGNHGKSNCCCGSLVCHAGMALAIDLFTFPHPAGARLIAEPPTGQPRQIGSGLERPPRATDIA